ncbi:MAG: ParB/RepB/Spo0J family partition protein [Thermosynechococcaceae cyanobacterium]
MGRFSKLLTSVELEAEDESIELRQLEGGKTEQRKFLSCAKIVRDETQVRKYFDPDKLKALAQTIAEEGILEDLAVFEIPDRPGYYQLIFGERRFRASQIAGLEQVPVRIIEQPDSKRLLKLQLIENKHHEDLNPIEEVEAVLELLSAEMGQPVEFVVMYLKQMDNDVRRSSYNVIGQPESDTVIQLLEGLNIKWRSFVLNQLQLLKLPLEILESIRSGRIEYTKALAIAKVKDVIHQSQLLKVVIQDNLSIREIRERVKHLNQSDSQGSEVQDPKLRWTAVTRQLSKSNIWDDPKKRKKLENLMHQVELLLGQ